MNPTNYDLADGVRKILNGEMGTDALASLNASKLAREQGTAFLLGLKGIKTDTELLNALIIYLSETVRGIFCYTLYLMALRTQRTESEDMDTMAAVADILLKDIKDHAVYALKKGFSDDSSHHQAGEGDRLN